MRNLYPYRNQAMGINMSNPADIYIFVSDYGSIGFEAISEMKPMTKSELIEELFEHDNLVQVLGLEWTDKRGGTFVDVSEDAAIEWLTKKWDGGDIVPNLVLHLEEQGKIDRSDYDQDGGLNYAELSADYRASVL
jgi:hypothetical protein